jgi:hypothetical protein
MGVARHHADLPPIMTAVVRQKLARLAAKRT